MTLKTCFQNSVLNYNNQVSQLKQNISLRQFIRNFILITISFILITSCKSYSPGNFFKQKDLIPTIPVWYPIDVSKKGSRVEMVTRIKEEDAYGFYLYFYYDLPINQNNKRFSEHDSQTCNFLCRAEPYLLVEPFNEQPFTVEELKESRKFGELLIGHHEVVNGKIVVTKKVSIPVRLQLFSVDTDGSQKLILDIESGIENDYYSVKFPKMVRALAGWGYYGQLLEWKSLRSGVYKVIIETLKDVPEFKGVKAEFTFEKIPQKI